MKRNTAKLRKNQIGAAHLAAVLLVIVLAAIGGIGWKVWSGQQHSEGKASTSNTSKDSGTSHLDDMEISVREEGELVLPNGYADPTVVATKAGYRMYVNRQSGGPSGYLTFTSADGITWTKESPDLVIPQVATGRAVVLPTGVRVYYPGPQPIRATDAQADMFSSFSTDGLNFTKDAGVRLSPRSADYYVEGPTVFQLPDKTWRMYFNENSIAAGNNRDGEIWGAKSDDGLTWIRDAALTLKADSVEAAPGGQRAPWKQVLHPFVLPHPDGGYIMFYNSHSEIFAATSADGLSWKKIGEIGLHGADIDGFFQKDGTIRVYYGDFSHETGGLVYSAVLEVK